MDMNEEISEFVTETEELIEAAEEALLAIEKGVDFEGNYKIVFRTLHNVKGTAGMYGLIELQDHVHKVETMFQETKCANCLSDEEVSFFLQALDDTRKICHGEKGSGNYSIENLGKAEALVVTQPNVKEEIISQDKVDQLKIVLIDDSSKNKEKIKKYFVGGNNIEIHEVDASLEMIDKVADINPEVIFLTLNSEIFCAFDFLEKANNRMSDTSIILLSDETSDLVLLKVLQSNFFSVTDLKLPREKFLLLFRNAVNDCRQKKIRKASIDFILFKYPNFEKYMNDNFKKEEVELMHNEMNEVVKLSKNYSLKENFLCLMEDMS